MADLKILKHNFDIAFYEMQLERNNQDIKDFISSSIEMSKDDQLSTYHDIENILFNEKLIDFKNFVLEHIGVFCKSLLNKNKFHTTKSWFQAYGTNNFHSLHTHGAYNHNYSLIYYVQATEKSSPTLFYCPGHPYIHMPSKSIIPKEGKLVIFPSYLPHEVPANNDEERIIFSANFNVEG